MKVKMITNSYFQNFKEALNICCNKSLEDNAFISDMCSASYDDKGKDCFYSDKYLSPIINMQTIKLDDISDYRKGMINLPERSQFSPLSAVDSVCIDSDNEWFFIEFKDANFDAEIKSIKKKMLNSLWYSFFMLSKSQKGNGVLDEDVIKFSREKITYIVVIKRDKNIKDAESIREKEAIGEHYHHPKLNEFINYYFKDVYVLTEFEFRDFVKNFKS